MIYAENCFVGVLTGRQTIPNQRLAALGKRRHCAIELPYFSAAIRCVPGTRLIATVPRRLADLERHDPGRQTGGTPAGDYGVSIFDDLASARAHGRRPRVAALDNCGNRP
jgi:hypothetical protein